MPDDLPEPEPEPTPSPEPEPTVPQWATDLKRTIEELPAKLKASVTDDDKSQIAEAVHGLFERSGAFVTEAEHEERETETETETVTDTPAANESEPKKGGLSGFASWFEGRK